ncbi:MAG: LarC family nickel insertion protein, partial [Clostridia bacterium]|nr:LarC family nickel insertion protein [Clostridia bacterium]
MSKILYIDCLSGISGDMTIGAFLDLGVDPGYLKQELSKLHVHGYELAVQKKMMRGITGTDFDVILVEHEHPVNGQHQQAEDIHDNHAHGDLGGHEYGGHDHINHHGQDHKTHDDHDHNNHHYHGKHHGQHDHEHHHEHNNWGQIKALIEESTLKEEVKGLALRIFKRVAEAEAKVHGVSLEEVHFHEVGAVDSIVDIVGAAICFDAIKPDRVVISPLNTGSGTVRC